MSMRWLALAVVALGTWAGPAKAAPGDLDSSFGHRGLAHSSPGGIAYNPQLVLSGDGRPIVAGSADLAPPSDARMGFGKLDFALARYTTRGRADRTFAGSGSATLALGGEDSLTALEATPNSILLAGQSRSQNPATYYVDGGFALARYSSQGRPDSGFGDDGWVSLPQTTGSFSTVALVHRLPSTLIVAVGPVDSNIGFVQLYDSGVPNQNFAPAGTKVVPFNGGIGSAATYLLDSRGGLLVAGTGRGGLDAVKPVVVQRFTLDGAPDPSFGVNGVATVGSTRGAAGPMALQSDGSVIVSFMGDRYADFGPLDRLVRISASGVLDEGFGTNGVADTIDLTSIAVDRADRIVVSGPLFTLARHERNGAPDDGFKAVRLPRAYRTGAGTDVAVARDGDILVAGSMTPTPGDPNDFSPTRYDFAVARFHGGDDATPPRIAVRGGSCSERALVIRVRDDSRRVRVLVYVDGRRVRLTRRSRTVIRVPTGRHRVLIRARDSSDNVAERRLRFRRCR